MSKQSGWPKSSEENKSAPLWSSFVSLSVKEGKEIKDSDEEKRLWSSFVSLSVESPKKNQDRYSLWPSFISQSFSPISPKKETHAIKTVINLSDLRLKDEGALILGDRFSDAEDKIFSAVYLKGQVMVKKYDFDINLDIEKKEAIVQRETYLMEKSRCADFIVDVRGYFFDPQYYLLMEYYKGGVLRTHLASTTDINIKINWAQKICYGLNFMHQQGIFHQNLKTANIWLDKTNQPKIGGFGSAGEIKNPASTMPANSTAWMAPELFQSKPHTKETDIYSLGIVLWEIITGKIPFSGKKDKMIKKSVLAGKRESLSEIPRIFKRCIEDCWNQDPKKRPNPSIIVAEFETVKKTLSSPPKADVRLSQNRSGLYKPTPVDEKELSKLLKLVADGEQKQAEKMIQNKKNLLLYPGNVMDLAGRTFKSITAFQYALWALDWHMWRMIKKYLPEEPQRQQFHEWKGRKQEQHFDLKPLINALKTYHEKFASWDHTRRKEHWVEVVGSLQKILPMHVIHEYCWLGRAFQPCPSFEEDVLPRCRKYDEGDDCLFPKKGQLGESFALIRGKSKESPWAANLNSPHGDKAVFQQVKYDSDAINKLYQVRIGQLLFLEKELTSETSAITSSPDFDSLKF